MPALGEEYAAGVGRVMRRALLVGVWVAAGAACTEGGDDVDPGHDMGVGCGSYGQVECGGECVHTEADPGHCGGCGAACATGQICRESECASCGEGEVGCGSMCCPSSRGCDAAVTACAPEACPSVVPEQGAGCGPLDARCTWRLCDSRDLLTAFCSPGGWLVQAQACPIEENP
jgi:hypothetical protein